MWVGNTEAVAGQSGEVVTENSATTGTQNGCP